MEVEDRDINVPTSTSSVPISWKNATVSTQRSKLSYCGCSTDQVIDLLINQNGQSRSQFFVVMGPSGCGKSTFLNLLAKRLSAYDVSDNAELKMGGQDYGTTEFKALSGYVLADDVLFPHLTVRETLEYAAKLRMSRSLSDHEKSQRVDEVIGQLGLEKCQHTPIGDSIIRGVSGGERKRVCIAIELLNKPRLLLLDTPTSGLDSATAFNVCKLLSNLARSGECSVICTLNQPQIKIFNVIDQILLLNRGQVLFQGPTQTLLSLYAEAGFPCPIEVNPADHILDVITPLFREDFEATESNLQQIRAVLDKGEYTQPEHEVEKIDHLDQLIAERQKPSWFKQFALLFHRAMITQYRDWFSLALQLVQTIIMSILIGTVYLDIGTTQASISKRQSALFFCCINQGVFSSLMAINSYPGDRSVVLRERAAGTYYVSAYFLAKNLVETISQFIFPLIFSCIVYFLIGFQEDAGKFFLFVLFMELCSMAANSWALLTSALAITVASSLSILPLAFEFARLFGGLYLSPAELPIYFVWIDVLSYVKYAYTGLSLNELNGLVYTCTPEELSPPFNGTCPVTSGQQTIDTLGLDYISIGGCIGVLIGMIIGIRFLAYLAVRFNKA